MQELPRETVLLAQKGEIAAFEAIYKIASGFVCTVAFKIVHSKGLAEEVTQEVFIKLFNSLGSFQFNSSFKTWLYRITINTAINAYRKQAKEKKRYLDFDEAMRSFGDNSCGREEIELRDRKRFLAGFLKKLTFEQRTTLILKEIAGLKYHEIGKIMHCNINTVRSRLTRARRALLALGKKEVVSHEL